MKIVPGTNQEMEMLGKAYVQVQMLQCSLETLQRSEQSQFSSQILVLL